MRSLCISVATSKLGIAVGEKLLEKLLEVAELGDYITGLYHEDNVKEAPECTVQLILVTTGGTEHVITNIAEHSKLTYLLYTSSYNSLPAVLEAVAYLRKHGFKFMIEKLLSTQYIADLAKRVERAVQAYNKIRHAKFGLIGGVSPWLVYSRVDAEKVRRAGLGELVEIPIEELYEAYAKTNVDERLVEELIRSAKSVSLESATRDVSTALKVYYAIKYIVEKYGLSDITIRCFDLIKNLSTTSCLALAILNNDLVPAACEGDIPLLYSMALGTWISGKPVFMGNIADVDENSVTLAHCTSWFAGPYSLYTHFESNLGVGLRVEYPVGSKVTLFRLDSDLERLRAGTGEIVEHDWKPYMCRTQVKIKLKNPEKILLESFGNHYALLLGDYMKELQVLSMLLNMQLDML